MRLEPSKALGHTPDMAANDSQPTPATSTRDDEARMAERQAERTALRNTAVVCAGLILTFYVVNSLSVTTEYRWSGYDFPASMPWVLEGTAILAMFVGLPFALWLGYRVPAEISRWRIALPVHIVGALIYAAIQILLMAFLRHEVWPLLYSRDYGFTGTWVEVAIYEGRKQIFSYAGFQVILATTRAIEYLRLENRAARREARSHHRITLHSGGRTLYPDAEAFRAAQAAGNYVEARFGDREHLARTTLTALEGLLREAGVDAVRVHRSWLVNRAAIAEIAPTGEGDVTLTLKSGETVPGSRRYRERLEVASAD